MPTTKLNLEKQNSQVVTNESGHLTSENISSNGENHLSTSSTNLPNSNGIHEGHVSSTGDVQSPFAVNSDQNLLLKLNSIQTCDSDLSGTTCMSLDGAGFTNGDITLDSRTMNHNGSVSNKDLHSEFSDNQQKSSSTSKSPDLRVKFSDGTNGIPPADNHIDSSDEQVPDENHSIGATGCDTKLDSPTEGATGGNPTLWLGDDQMLLLPGKSHSEETDSNSGTSETKSFEGLLSPNGTSILWDEDTDWILLFDNMIRYADRKQQRTTRSCGCRVHFWLNGYVNKQNCRIWSEANPQAYVETPLHAEKLTVWCALWAGGILLQKR
ncbi:uncharacterized protein TNCV_4649491 [Trichonephila clavipes]|uniref:Uncharacterized protein n=1 Tax=Trichonephila clavipes TaxID=2585209 RepID=A0A8X6VRW6_TRICX|nr:uncharacterized protein TNCV_4649491 [Trichonephila clavipes]